MEVKVTKARTSADRQAELVQLVAPEVAAYLPTQSARDAFTRTLLSHVAGDPKLQACTPASIVGAASLAARRGWEIGYHCYLYARQPKTGPAYAVLHPGVQGLTDLAYRSGVTAVGVVMVHARDQRSQVDGIVHHACDPWADRGELVGAWAWARLASGERIDETLTMAQLDAIEAAGQTKGDSPWTGPFREEMQKKSALRRLLKRAPTTPEAGRALAEMDAHEYGDAIDVTPAAPAPYTAPALSAPTQHALPEAQPDTVAEAPKPAPKPSMLSRFATRTTPAEAAAPTPAPDAPAETEVVDATEEVPF